jgi:tetratricopeptide (TPR) repeat protein
VDPLTRGVEAYARGDWEAASNLARERLKKVKDDSAAIRLLARAAARLGQDASVLSLYQRLGSGAMLPDDLYLLGVSLGRTGNPKGAVEVWEQALKVDPDHADTLYEMTKIHLQADRFQAAATLANQLIKHPHWRKRASELLGRIEMGRNQPGSAIEFWQFSLEHQGTEPGVAPSWLVTRKALVRALLCVRRPAEARKQIQLVLAGRPDAEASWLLSRAYLQEGALADARAALREAGTFADENPTLLEAAPFAGAASCAQCHFAKFQSQQSSRHARTFHGASELGDLQLPRTSVTDPIDSRVTHTLKKGREQIEQKTRTAEHLYQAVIDYAFGSGDRGKTLLGHDPSRRMFELRLSVYREGTSQALWDVTTGHAAHPVTDQGFLGMSLSEDAVRRCFTCHVTNPQAALGRVGPEADDHGIGCEKCHGPGGNHLLAVAAKFPELAISRPSVVSGERVVKICAQCHSPRGKGVEPDDPTSVRFQGTTLTWSRCYTESKDRLDCVTCHDPHRNVAASLVHYEAKCLLCHAGDRDSNAVEKRERLRRFDLNAAPRVSPCPVSPSTGCISCHMPKVKDAIPHSPFTDHFIRVHREFSTVGRQ